MKALVKERSAVSLRDVPRPGLSSAEDVLIRVMAAGLCRTDLYVAEGRLPCPEPLILGHEFAGIVAEVGPAVRGLAPGDRVAVLPVISCRNCAECVRGSETTCLARRMLGLDRDGAFAEYIVVPARVLYRVPASLSFEAAAYAEPVAAALAVLHSGIQPHERGLIWGRNRFALLIEQILQASGFTGVSIHDARPDRAPPANSYDFAIETFADTEALAAMVRTVRPFGRIVLKSRPARPAGIDLNAAVLKELTFRAVNYGPFGAAVSLLAEGRIDVKPLLGPLHPLEDFEAVFAAARRDEATKFFFAPARSA
jgi:L-iditol 2-dehydrogenase